MAERETTTLRITNLPQITTAFDFEAFLESHLGPDSVFAVEIPTDRQNWKPRSYARVQFTSVRITRHALALIPTLRFLRHDLTVSDSFDDIIPRPKNPDLAAVDACLHAGIMLGPERVGTIESWDNAQVWVMPERKRVEFFVWVDGGEGEKECYKIEVSFDDVLESIGFCLEGKMYALLLKLKYGPKIYRKYSGPNVVSKFSSDRYHICKEDFDHLWIRTTDFSALKSVGHATTLCWDMNEKLLELADPFNTFPFYREGEGDLLLETANKYCSASETVPLLKFPENATLSYEIFFQLNSLVHAQKLLFTSVYTNLIELFESLSPDIANAVIQELHKLSSTCYDPISLVRTLSEKVREKNKKFISAQVRLMTSNVMSIHRALVTPSKIYCLGPELESSNYVVKKFAEFASDFLRVTFVDEDWGKLQPNAVSAIIENAVFRTPKRTKIYDRILRILREGIAIGPKRYEFLAFSASQLRSNAVWMFASNETVSAGEIREWMGCFRKIRSISKCAARMGQLFSSSRQTVTVPAREVEIIPDVEVQTDGVKYCFSDGIGKISSSFARQVARHCGLSESASAYQIRYGGYKGVIAVDPGSFRKLSLRKSMLKFESESRMLNVTKWCTAMPCYLNREIVTLLSTLGAEDEAFLDLERAQLSLLGRMLSERESALTVLESLDGLKSPDVLVKMLRQGYDPDSEPYLSMVLRSRYENQLTDLRTRCRVFVPKGRILLGCLDEGGILEYGQVYVRLTPTRVEQESGDHSFFKKLEDGTLVLVGKVVVTKNPCLHPGDVRVLDAVYDPEFQERGLIDCLVFPQKGHRPHPSECSGGDLDGDAFFISWDSTLIPPRTATPMDYTARRPRIMDHDVTLEEIHKFFVEYMINDTLGGISTAHLVHADREPDKAFNEKCLELADLHSMAVDFAKSGAPAEMPLVLKPKEFPDFMERFDRPSYISEGALGKLYRATLEAQGSDSNESLLRVWSAEEAYDKDLEAEGFEGFVEAAESHRDAYAEKFSGIMIYYGAKSEVEILTGNFRKKAAYLQRDNRRYGDMKDRIALASKSLRREARQWFDETTGGDDHRRRGLASAWYHVTYHPRFRLQKPNFLSFPWINGDDLLEIKAMNSRRTSIADDKVTMLTYAKRIKGDANGEGLKWPSLQG